MVIMGTTAICRKTQLFDQQFYPRKLPKVLVKKNVLDDSETSHENMRVKYT